MGILGGGGVCFSLDKESRGRQAAREGGSALCQSQRKLMSDGITRGLMVINR